VAESGRGSVLWRRLLDPTRTAADRGMQEAVIDVPAAAGDKVILSTGCGPRGACAFDWTYWSGVRFAPGPPGGAAVR
jgi:hypothetical protein